MSKKRKIPFKLCPASWGLKGKSYERAKIEYELDGYDMELALLELDYSGKDLEKHILKLNAAHKKITNYDCDIAVAKLELEGDILAKRLLDIEKEAGIISQELFERLVGKLGCKTDTEKALVDLELDLKYKNISDKEYSKKRATILKEPWVDILGMDFDVKNPTKGGAFNLDWNDEFVEYLKKNGYMGLTDEHIVDKWFSSLFESISKEDDFLGGFQEHAITRSIKTGNNTEYS